MLGNINWAEVAPKCEAHLKDKVLPLLNQHGATVVKTGFNDDDYVQRSLTINFRGEEIRVGSNAFDRVKELQWFLEHFDEVKAIADSYIRPGGNLNPFHSDIYRDFRTKYGERRGTRPIGDKHAIQMAYNYVCDAIRKAGGKVWTD